MPQHWEPIPLYTYIIELLEKKKGASTDDDLYKTLKERFGEIDSRTFNKALMKLEVSGLIRVSSLSKNMRNIELTPQT